MDAISLKEKGNEEFKRENFRGAIDFYTKAIEISNDPNLLFSNRAQCYRKLSMWEECYKDALEALEMQELNIKAQMLCGQALLQLSKKENSIDKVELGIKRLTRAYSLCSSQNKRSFEKDILVYLARGKKLLWLKRKELESLEKQQLFESIQKIEESNKTTPENQKLSNLEELRSVLFENDQKCEVPDFMKDPLTQKIMSEPIIIPSGESYDKESFEEFIKVNGLIDPKNRSPLSRGNIFPNLTLKKIIEEFMEQNPWAFEFTQGENYMNILF